jgi:hypothetical protein
MNYSTIKKAYLFFVFVLVALFFYPASVIRAAECGFMGPGGMPASTHCEDPLMCDYSACGSLDLIPGCIQCVSAGCTPVNGGWSSFGSCLATGFQYRECDNPVPSCGGTYCTGNNWQACTYSAAFVCPAGSVCVENPLHANNFEELLDNIINFIFWVGMALVPIMIIIAGFNFVTAGGDPKKVTTAKNIILWTAVGLIIILMAKGLTAVFMGIIGG